MEETLVESFTLEDAGRKSVTDEAVSVNKRIDDEAGNGNVDAETENRPSSNLAIPMENENAIETSAEASNEVPASSNSNAENKDQGDIPRNTPPPVYSGENESNDLERPFANVEKSANVGMTAGPDNFWLVGNYKKVTKKIEDGSKLCEDLSQMMLERAEMENLYAKKLKAWNKKWNQAFSKELEYGTVLQSLLRGLSESNEIADIHLAICGKISEVSSQVQKWKSETYHRGIIGLKEAKKAEEGFGKAQKPWAKKYEDTIKGRQNYHTACQVLDSMKAQEEELILAKDTTTQEQLLKVQNKVKKATQDKATSLEFYKESIRDILGYNQKYKDDMIHQYDKWETADRTRKDFVIEKMNLFKECVDLSQFQSRIEHIYTNMSEAYAGADSAADVDLFRSNFGPNLPFIDISFIEYNQEDHPTTKPKIKDQSQPTEVNSSEKPKEKSKVCVAL